LLQKYADAMELILFLTFLNLKALGMVYEFYLIALVHINKNK